MANLASPENPFEVGDDVQYDSIGRPYLAGFPGKILSFNAQKTSALVKFTRPDGSTLQEWIGFSAIKKAPASDSVEETIRKELRQVTEEFTTVSAQYRKLNTRKSQLEAALRALNATFR
jgi:hypothetical protein